MYNSKARIIATTFIIFVISLLFINSNYANNLKLNNNELTDWKVAITSDTKELNDTRKISFKVQESKDVVDGKIAPGLKATATVEINLIGTRVPVDIKANVDDSTLPNGFKITMKLDGEEYINGTTKKFELAKGKEFTEKEGTKILLIELEWLEVGTQTQIEEIKLPVTINVMQHIGK